MALSTELLALSDVPEEGVLVPPPFSELPSEEGVLFGSAVVGSGSGVVAVSCSAFDAPQPPKSIAAQRNAATAFFLILSTSFLDIFLYFTGILAGDYESDLMKM